MISFLELIAKERASQINEKGYKPEHDDKHMDGSLADAAACYAAETKGLLKRYGTSDGLRSLVDPLWPWHPKYFKKNQKSRKQQLITAGALIIAELERLERLEENNG